MPLLPTRIAKFFRVTLEGVVPEDVERLNLLVLQLGPILGVDHLVLLLQLHVVRIE